MSETNFIEKRESRAPLALWIMHSICKSKTWLILVLKGRHIMCRSCLRSSRVNFFFKLWVCRCRWWTCAHKGVACGGVASCNPAILHPILLGRLQASLIHFCFGRTEPTRPVVHADSWEPSLVASIVPLECFDVTSVACMTLVAVRSAWSRFSFPLREIRLSKSLPFLVRCHLLI